MLYDCLSIDEKNPLVIKINATLSRDDYNKIKRQLSFIGEWSRKHQGILCETDPVPLLDLLKSGKVDIKQETNYFPTPSIICDLMKLDSGIRYDESPSLRILEPSAGRGAIISELMETIDIARLDITAIEFNAINHSILRSKFPSINAIHGDFLTYTDSGWDYIFMNPPFNISTDDGTKYDIDHIRHAYDLLGKRGRLVALSSQKWINDKSKRFESFRQWLNDLANTGKATWYSRVRDYGDEYRFTDTNVDVSLFILDK